ncbi:MAG TPA: hypothetical protein VNW06_03565 [Cytophagaceae bacterium]|jgi:hypothetical protein|nr:hypothetical protein [Cytophagaceae bacterium]
MDLKEKKKIRFQFLKAVYDVTDGDETAIVNGEEIGKDISLDWDTASNVIQYLFGENLVEPRGMGLHIGITHSGVIEIEEALNHPEKPTAHFPAINLISIQNMTNSVIQQSSPGAAQNINLNIEQSLPDLNSFLSELKTSINKLNLTIESQNEMLAEIQTVEAQANSPKPKALIIREGLNTIRNLLEGVATEAIAPLFIQKVGMLLSAINPFIS